MEAGGIRFTSLDRVVWPAERITKGEMVRYYVRIADVMLRYFGARALMLKRYHSGLAGRAVVQHRAAKRLPDAVRTAQIPTAAGEPMIRYVGAPGTLLFAAQMNAIELHAWHSRVEAPERPDWIVLDLDPSRGAGFRKVARVAMLAVAPYSLRALPRAPVSMPIDWAEVEETLNPRGFTLRDVPGHLERLGDAWRGFEHGTTASSVRRAVEELGTGSRTTDGS